MGRKTNVEEFLVDLRSRHPKLRSAQDVQEAIGEGSIQNAVIDCVRYLELEWACDGEWGVHLKFRSGPFRDAVRLCLQGQPPRHQFASFLRSLPTWDGDAEKAKYLVSVLTTDDRRVFDLHDTTGLQSFVAYLAVLKNALSSPTGSLRPPRLSDEALRDQLESGDFSNPYFLEAREDVRRGALCDALLNFTKPFCLRTHVNFNNNSVLTFKQRGLEATSILRLDHSVVRKDGPPAYSSIVLLRGLGEDEYVYGSWTNNAVVQDYLKEGEYPSHHLQDSDIVFDLSKARSAYNLLGALLRRRDRRIQGGSFSQSDKQVCHANLDMGLSLADSNFLEDLLADDPRTSEAAAAQHHIEWGQLVFAVRGCLQYLGFNWQYNGEFSNYLRFSIPPFQGIAAISFQGLIPVFRTGIFFESPVSHHEQKDQAKLVAAVITAEQRCEFSLHDKQGLHALVSHILSLKKSLQSGTGTLRSPRLSDEDLLSQLDREDYRNPYFIEAREDIRRGCLVDALLNFTKPFRIGSYKPFEERGRIEFKQHGLRSISVHRLDRLVYASMQVPAYSTIVVLRGIKVKEESFGVRVFNHSALVSYIQNEDFPSDRLQDRDIAFDLALPRSVFDLMTALLAHRDRRAKARNSAQSADTKVGSHVPHKDTSISIHNDSLKPHGVLKRKTKEKLKPLAIVAMLNQASKAPTCSTTPTQWKRGLTSENDQTLYLSTRRRP
ncbi:hypothetical protein BU16DRAFT_613958 [Lophium mytilinum]|uniref:Uncharacterized protein n=1 Tax=Lophium mytilinum TaxID=390894 RepID=A0A6A6R5U0_9PEZI|nr:hypothetical protein BU16DRAFT_613958 [Lophium mytilinum]